MNCITFSGEHITPDLFKSAIFQQIKFVKTYYGHWQSYRMFMQAFKRVYPDLHNKYKKNISVNVSGNGSVVIDRQIPISAKSTSILTGVISKYYNALNN